MPWSRPGSWPGTGLVLDAPKPGTGSKIALLGHDGALAWKFRTTMRFSQIGHWIRIIGIDR